jgi:cation transport regulator
MPYSSLADLPSNIKKLPKHAQEIWLAAFNSAYKNVPEGQNPEAYAFAVANSAVKKAGYSFKSEVGDTFEVFQIQQAECWKDSNGDMFIKVPVSGVVEDRQGDEVSRSCGDKMIEQYNSGTLPLYGDHGVDENGRKSYSWKNILGKWVKGEWSNNKIDIMATSRLNKANPDAIKLFEYVEQKMPVGFSIGGKKLKIREVDY